MQILMEANNNPQYFIAQHTGFATERDYINNFKIILCKFLTYNDGFSKKPSWYVIYHDGEIF